VKILYVLHPKSTPRTWQRSGDTNMATRMIKHMKEGVEIDVFSDFSEYTRERSSELIDLLEEYGISGAINSAPYIEKRTYLKESMKFIRTIADQYDLIHFHNATVASIHWMTHFFEDCEVPLVYTMHTPPESSSFQFFHGDEYKVFGKNPNVRLVAVSETHYGRVLNALNVSDSEMPSLTYIRNGIEYTPLSQSGDKVDVSVIGRLDPSKDILHSLKAARACSPDGRVVYVGNTTSTSVSNEVYMSEVETFIEEEGIEWIQHLTNEEVQQLLADSKVHIALSRIETYGLTVVESQMQGTPVLGFNAGGIGENIQDGVSGYYVEARGAWKKRYGKIAEQYQEAIKLDRGEIVNRARQLFDISHTTASYYLLYEDLIRGDK
jgi:glycosyltransferase involved in cell wall biosynthesis